MLTELGKRMYTHSATVERLHEIQARMEELSSKHRMSKAEQQEFDSLAEDFEDFDNHRQRLERADEIRSAAGGGGGGRRFKLERGSVGDGDEPRGDDARSVAMHTLERAVNSGRLAARGAELVEELMQSGPRLAQTWTQRYAAAAGSETYERAFAKLVANPTQGHLEWTPEEADAYRRVAQVQGEQRAMSTSDSAGGYMIPLTLDPAIMLTSNGSVNPLRQISRVVQTATDQWQGVTSAGVTAEWIAEAAEVADASPTLDDAPIPVHKADAFVPFSFEVQGDAVNFMQELGKLLQDGAEQLSAAAYTSGSGTGQPRGVVTALVAAAGTVPLVAPASAETLAPGDVFSVQNALPPRFQPRAVWNANLSILNTLRQFETTNGALKFPELQGNPPMLLGRAMYENSNMDGAINTGATENNYPLLYGDFGQFVIVDRIGSTIELVPHLFGSNRRPTGQRGALLWFRTGSDVVIPNAFRLLSIPTAA